MFALLNGRTLCMTCKNFVVGISLPYLLFYLLSYTLIDKYLKIGFFITKFVMVQQKRLHQLLSDPERRLIIGKLNYKNHKNPSIVRQRLTEKIKNINKIVKIFLRDLDLIMEYLGRTDKRSNKIYELIAEKMLLDPFFRDILNKKSQEINKALSEKWVKNKSIQLSRIQLSHETYKKLKKFLPFIKNKKFRKLIPIFKKHKIIYKGILKKKGIQYTPALTRMLNNYTKRGVLEKIVYDGPKEEKEKDIKKKTSKERKKKVTKYPAWKLTRTGSILLSIDSSETNKSR